MVALNPVADPARRRFRLCQFASLIQLQGSKGLSMNSALVSPGVTARICDDIELKIASTREEREGAFGLIYRSYLRANLCEPNELGLRITPFQTLPTTNIFVAKLRGEVISTLTLVRDSERGLPMEQLYPDEVNRRRWGGSRLAEVSCLADRRSGRARFLGLFRELAQLMVQHAVLINVDELVIAVHPRHSALYKRYMAFKRIGEYREYEAVCGNPAVPMGLDLRTAKKEVPEHWARFFGRNLPTLALQSRPITSEDRSYFEGLLEHQQELAEAEDNGMLVA